MFTGLVQKIGSVKRVSRGRGLVLEFAFEPWERPLAEGESVAVNGVCLTVAKRDAGRFTADVLEETVRRSNLKNLVPGDRVNLERAVLAGDPLGGHIVQGHVDCTGTVREIRLKGRDRQMIVGCGRVVAAQSVLKGSVALDGVSLTISALGEDFLGVDLIPSTLAGTTLGFRRTGDELNIESDVFGKYAAGGNAKGGLSEADLLAAGFI